MLGMKGILMILGVAIVFFGIFYTAISLAKGQFLHLLSLEFAALIVSVVSGAMVVFVYIYKGDKIGE